MSQRTLYLICYDISHPRRLYRVYKYLLGFKVGGQKSFFECWLTRGELRECQQRLQALIQPQQDRVHIFQLDPRMQPSLLGKGSHHPVNHAFLIV